jgi:hypothetical protein
LTIDNTKRYLKRLKIYGKSNKKIIWRQIMYAVKAIYDGHNFKLDESVPVKGKYEVIIAFTKPVEKDQENILKFFGTWDEDDVNCMEEIIKERKFFSLGRTEI